MITTTAAVLHETPGWLDVGEIQIDEPGRNEVLIRMAASGLCHSDLNFMSAKYPVPVPIVMGHESSGVVEAVGADVTYVKPGDHVVTCLSTFCGECAACLTGHPNLCSSTTLGRPAEARPRLSEHDHPVNQFAGLGSFSEVLLVHEHSLVKVSKDIPLDRAALIGCGVITGVGAVFHTTRVEPGSTVAVIGCGGIGLNVVQGAILAGAGRVIAVDLRASKLALARRFGATDTVDASAVDAVEAVAELTGGGVDYSFEAIGVVAATEQAFGMLRRGGTATVIGMIPVGQNVQIPGSALLQEKRLQGSFMGSNRFRVDIPQLVELYLQGRLKLDELISARISIGQVNEGFKVLETGEVARSVIVPG
jgi:S-(hydroxymethyl)glutathione dehydrogenase / alcohol dehydrogenase